MAGMDREFKELLISVTTVIIGFWAIVQLTSGLIWDWNAVSYTHLTLPTTMWV